MISFTVYGLGQPAGSKRAFTNPRTGRPIVTDANPRSKPWQRDVATAGAQTMRGRPLLQGPLIVQFVFYRPRPKSHYGTGKNAGIVKASAQPYPIGPPDVLKLSRGVEDALTKVVWGDDAQIVAETLVKKYGDPPRVEITVRPAAKSYPGVVA